MESGRARILLLSDSHGSLAELRAALSLAAEADQVVHLGDGAADMGRLLLSGLSVPPWTGLRGNMDSGAPFPESVVLDAAGQRVLAVHGHRQRAHADIAGVAAAAAEVGAKIAFFGHTHRPFFGRVGGVALVNPGSLSRPRGRAEGSFAVVGIGEDGAVSAQFYLLRPTGNELRVEKAPEGFADGE